MNKDIIKKLNLWRNLRKQRISLRQQVKGCEAVLLEYGKALANDILNSEDGVVDFPDVRGLSAYRVHEIIEDEENSDVILHLKQVGGIAEKHVSLGDL